MWINSADDFINPPELGIAEKESQRLKNGTFILIPISEQTRGAWRAYPGCGVERLSGTATGKVGALIHGEYLGSHEQGATA